MGDSLSPVPHPHQSIPVGWPGGSGLILGESNPILGRDWCFPGRGEVSCDPGVLKAQLQMINFSFSTVLYLGRGAGGADSDFVLLLWEVPLWGSVLSF